MYAVVDEGNILAEYLVIYYYFGGSSKGDRKFPAVINYKIFRKGDRKFLKKP